MKKLLWLLALLVCLSIAGCDGASDAPSPSPQESGDKTGAASDAPSNEEEDIQGEDSTDTVLADDLVQKLYGDWATPSGTLFTFRENGECGFYRSKDARETDYYYGWEMDILHGEAALDDLGLVGRDREVSMYSEPEYVYSLKLYYTYLHQDGEDVSHLLIDDGFQHMMFRLLDDDHAAAVAVNTMTTYDLTRIG